MPTVLEGPQLCIVKQSAEMLRIRQAIALTECLKLSIVVGRPKIHFRDSACCFQELCAARLPWQDFGP